MYMIDEKVNIYNDRYEQEYGSGIEYFGQRRTTDGKIEEAFMAGNIMRLLYSGDPQPIFSLVTRNNYEIPLPHVINRKMDDSYINIHQDEQSPDKQVFKFVPTPNTPLVLNKRLKESIISKPLVFLITSKVHAILYIISEATLYSVGFGYQDLKSLGLSKFRKKITPLNGALYSTDFLMPKEKQGSQISWIGYFTEEMANKIEQILGQTAELRGYVEECKEIETNEREGRERRKKRRKERRRSMGYNEADEVEDTDPEDYDELDPDKTKKYCVYRNKYILQLRDQPYLEVAGVAHAVGLSPEITKARNCITWAEYILGVQLNCGLITDPALCKEVTQDELFHLINSLSSNSAKVTSDTIRDIQQRLSTREPIHTELDRSSIHYLGKPVTEDLGKSLATEIKTRALTASVPVLSNLYLGVKTAKGGRRKKRTRTRRRHRLKTKKTR